MHFNYLCITWKVFFISKRKQHSLRTFFFHCRQIVLRRAFKKLDKDGSGFLTRDEILDAASNEAELDVSAEKISDMLIYLVKDDDKKVDFLKFSNVTVFYLTTVYTNIKFYFFKHILFGYRSFISKLLFLFIVVHFCYSRDINMLSGYSF